MSKAKDSALLKQAIIDAAALREGAVENAKESLLERFTPKLKAIVQDSMIAASEDDDTGEDDDEEEEPLEMDLDDPDDDSDTDPELSESDIDEIAAYLSKKEAVATDQRHSDTDVADRLSDRQPQHDDDTVLDLDGVGTGYHDLSDDDALDEIRDTLGIDEIISSLVEQEQDVEEKAMEEAIRRIFQEMEDEGELHTDESDHMDEEITFDIDLNEYGVTSLDRDPMDDAVGQGGTYLELVDDLTDDADDYTSFDPEGAGARVNIEDPSDADPLEEEIDLSGILYEMEDEDYDNEEDMSEHALRRKNRALREKLGKYRKAVGILRDQIRESKLVTKKLQYTNKLFNEANLSSKQRDRVIEGFDRAETPREVELTYTQLAENLEAGDGRINESVRRTRRGGASRRQASTKPETRPINESTNLKERFQELAGIL